MTPDEWACTLMDSVFDHNDVEMFNKVAAVIHKAVVEEREACANFLAFLPGYDEGDCSVCSSCAEEIAAAIRARSS
jgi:hypothetical protein